MSDAREDVTAEPVAEHAAPTAATAAQQQQVKGQMGIAVLMVLVCLAMLAPFTASFNYQSRVDWQSAINVRDEVGARQVQRGAMQLSLLLFEIQRMVFNQKQFRDFMGNWDITQVAPYLMSIFGTEDGAEGIGALTGFDASALSDLAIEGGSFEYRVYAESGKINVNCLANQVAAGKRNNPAGRTIETLEALMSPTIYDPLFEEEKADGQYYSRAQIMQAMADYIDDDRQRFDLVKLRSGRDAKLDLDGSLIEFTCECEVVLAVNLDLPQLTNQAVVIGCLLNEQCPAKACEVAGGIHDVTFGLRQPFESHVTLQQALREVE